MLIVPEFWNSIEEVRIIEPDLQNCGSRASNQVAWWCSFATSSFVLLEVLVYCWRVVHQMINTQVNQISIHWRGQYCAQINCQLSLPSKSQ